MPGIEPLAIAVHPAGLTAGCRDYMQLTVRLEHDAGFALGKDDPPAIRRVSCEIVTHAVVAGPIQGLRNSTPTMVERNPVEIELDRVHAVERMDVCIFDLGADVGDILVKLVSGFSSRENNIFFIPNNFSIFLIFNNNIIPNRLNPAATKPLYLISTPTSPNNDW